MGLFTRYKDEAPTVIVAAASQINLEDKKEVERALKLRQKWQNAAWAYWRSVGELKFAANFVANSLSKIRLYVAELGDDGEPMPTEDEAVKVQLERVQSPIGGQPEIIRRLALNLFIAGECYLVGHGEKDGEPETFGVSSISEAKYDKGSKKLKILDSPDSKDGKELDPENDFFLRIWLPDGEWGARADSSVQAVLETCEEILLLARAKRAVARNRAMGNGILYINSKLTQDAPDPTQDEGDGNAQITDPTLRDLLKHMTAPLENEGSAAAAVPMVMRGDVEPDKAMKHFSFDRTVDEVVKDWLGQAIERLAQGLDLPPEIVKGLANVNHWTAWQIDEATYKGNFEPRAILICDALTTGWLRPALEAANVANPEKYLVWFDPAALVVRPNKVQDAKDLHQANVISDQALREAASFSDDDAPDEEELRRRIDAKRPINRPPVDDPDKQGPPPDGPGEEEDAQTAAANLRARELPGFGRRLLAMDRQLRDRLVAAADAAVRRAIEKVGARLRTNAQRSGASLRAAIDGVPSSRVAFALGRSVVASLGRTDDELLEGAFDEITRQFDEWTTLYQRRALNLVPDLTDDERRSAERRQDEDRDDAREWFITSLMDLAKGRLYDPDPQAPEHGEFDETVVVPYGIVREAVARAGGAASSVSLTAGLIERIREPEQTLWGIATGWLLKELFADKDIVVEGFEWDYGVYPRTRPFEPHVALDGVEFTNFDDEQLRNDEGWPAVAFYIPGDHDGCYCDFVQKMIRIER